MASDPDSPHVIVLPPLLYVAALAAGLLLNWAAPFPILSGDARYWAGGAREAAARDGHRGRRSERLVPPLAGDEDE